MTYDILRNLKFRYKIIFNLLIFCQIHFLFYSSRTLPNIFSLPLVTLAWIYYCKELYTNGIILLGISTILFRCDTILIAIPYILMILYKGYYKEIIKNYKRIFIKIFTILFITILATCFIDTYFWYKVKEYKNNSSQVLYFIK